MTWKLTIAGTIERCRANPRPYWPKVFLARTISRHTVVTVLIRESAKGLNEEMKIVTALSPMLRAARTQMVAAHVLLGVHELSNYKSQEDRRQHPGRVIEYCRAA